MESGQVNTRGECLLGVLRSVSSGGYGNDQNILHARLFYTRYMDARFT